MLLVSSLKDMETKMIVFSFLNPFFYVLRITCIFSRHGHQQCGTRPVSVSVLPRVTTGVTSMVTLSGR